MKNKAQHPTLIILLVIGIKRNNCLIRAKSSIWWNLDLWFSRQDLKRLIFDLLSFLRLFFIHQLHKSLIQLGNQLFFLFKFIHELVQLLIIHYQLMCNLTKVINNTICEHVSDLSTQLGFIRDRVNIFIALALRVCECQALMEFVQKLNLRGGH